MARKLRVLAACEASGRVRDAFAARGWESWSCDLLPSTEVPAEVTVFPNGEQLLWPREEARGAHYQGDVLDLFDWDHPVNAQRRNLKKADVDRLHRETPAGQYLPMSGLPLWDLVIAFPPCFPAGTPVLTARGVIPIEEVAVGDKVLTHLGRWQRVLRVMTREHDLVSDGVTTATPDHPFYTRVKAPSRYTSNSQLPFTLLPPEWTEAKGVEGKFLALPASAETLPVPEVGGRDTATGFAFWYMVGRWLGDGWLRIKDGTAASGANRQRNDVIICSSFEEASELEIKLKEAGLSWHRAPQRTTVRFTASHFELARWLRQHFGEHAHAKTLPGWLFGMREADRYAVLCGYLAADGYKVSADRYTVSSVSRCLAVGIRLLATSLGYTTGLYKSERASHSIEGRAISSRPAWQVRIRHDDGRFTRVDDGLHRWVKQRKPMLPAGRSAVYDLTVAEDHSFVANGFVVHNCTDLTLGGARWFKDKDITRGGDGRMQEGAAFFMDMVYASKGNDPPCADRVAVENPLGKMSRWYRWPDQVVEPWWFGSPYAKRTGLWLRNLPRLVADKPVAPVGRVATGGGSWRTDKTAERVAMSRYEDSRGRENRAYMRSLTFESTARAMTDQWGAYVEREEDFAAWRRERKEA